MSAVLNAFALGCLVGWVLTDYVEVTECPSCESAGDSSFDHCPECGRETVDREIRRIHRLFPWLSFKLFRWSIVKQPRIRDIDDTNRVFHGEIAVHDRSEDALHGRYVYRFREPGRTTHNIETDDKLFEHDDRETVDTDNTAHLEDVTESEGVTLGRQTTLNQFFTHTVSFGEDGVTIEVTGEGSGDDDDTDTPVSDLLDDRLPAGDEDE